jgi:hypothetical protein
MSETLTHWKKNNDPRYISGEDLKDGESIGKGLRPEMVVIVTAFEDKPVFDKKDNKEIIKTGFWLREYPSDKPVYKPMILNNKNADFWIKETGSPFMENWLNKPSVIWAQPDARHGHVARFKKYYPPVTITDTAAIAKLAESKTLAELQTNWTAISKKEQKLPTVIAKKDELKGVLK